MIKILVWADSPAAFTGFGIVTKNVIGALHASGKYDIHQLAINHNGSFVDSSLWQMVPAKLSDPKDPYGTGMFLNAVQSNDYDIIWILNDAFVTHRAVEPLKKILQAKQDAKRVVPKTIYYYPVDCNVKKAASAMIEFADFPVAYTSHGYETTIKTLPELEGKIRVIHHGVDVNKFFPYSRRIVEKLKKEIFNLEPEDYIIINVNRNTMRKQLPRTLLAYAEFRKKHPNAKLYLHTNPLDRGLDLLTCIEELGLRINHDVYMPPNYSPLNGVPDQVLNQLYNCGDMFLTTHLGEGWGLTVTEAMAAGVPVVAPDNTSMTEIIGEERGYLYPCNELTYIDPSGYRPVGSMESILRNMEEVYQAGWKYSDPRVALARTWAERHDWSIINEQWKQVFEQVITTDTVANNKLGETL